MVGAQQADLLAFRRTVLVEVVGQLAELRPPAGVTPQPTVGDVWLDGEPGPASDEDRTTLRYSSLTVPPHSPWIVSPATIEGARCALETLRTHAARLADADTVGTSAEPSTDATAFRGEFYDLLTTRLDTLAAVELLWQVVRCNLAAGDRRALLLEFDGILGLGLAAAAPPVHDLPAASLPLIEERNAARGRKDWTRSDELREQLAALGVEAQDTREGSVYRRLLAPQGD